MSKDEVTTVVRATLAVFARLAAQTRSQADDLLMNIWKANEAKLAEAVLALVQDPQQPPTAERVTAALAAVGIRV